MRGSARSTMTVTALVLAGALVSHAQAPATIQALDWMSGAWVSATGSVTVEEHWTAPSGGAMLGVNRTVGNGRMVAFEYLRIVERDGRLFYVAQPNGRPPTEFASTSVGPGRVVFENPKHDFPTRITYIREASDRLVAEVSGPPDGQAAPDRFVFTRRR